MGQVVVVGYLSIDSVAGPDGAVREQPGGAALYAALGARAAGAEHVTLLAATGEDWPLAWTAEARRLGVDCASLEPRHGPARRARITYADDDSRSSAHHAEATWWERTEALAPPLPPRLSPEDVLVLSPMPAAHAARALDAAGPVRAVADTSEAFARQESDALRALLPRLAVFAPSREESRWLRPLEGCAVVEKRGAEGLALLRADMPEEVFMPSPVTVRDPTGAGDATVGAIAAGLARGLVLCDAMLAAVEVGARAVTGHGPAGLGFHA